MLSVSAIKSAGQAASYYSSVNDYYASKGEKEKGEDGIQDEVLAIEAEHALTSGDDLDIATSKEEMVQLMQRNGGRGEHLREVFHGSLSKELGVSNGFDKERFIELLNGKVDSNTRVGRIKNGVVEHRAGWDLTFSAPKSASILALVGGDGRIVEAHHKAVESALTYAEKTACVYRNNNKHEAGKGFVSALFTHAASRNLDPNLHTHSVVMNLTKTKEGSFKSIESRALFKNKMLLGEIYRAELAQILRRDLGYKLVPHKQFGFEIDGVNPELIKQFSSRRVEIEAVANDLGLSSAQEMAQATLKTRKTKERANSESLVERWVGGAGDDKVKDLRNLVNSSLERKERGDIEIDADAVTDVKLAIEHFATREAVFNHDQVIEFCLKNSLGNYSIDAVEKAIKQEIREKRLVVSKRESGKYTTQKAINKESLAINLMKQGKTENKVKPIMSKAASRKLIDEMDAKALKAGGFRLTEGQRSSFSLLATTSHQFIGIQGGAGTGKTVSLTSFREVAEKKGYAVKGFAPTGTAAQKMFEETGIHSQTVDSFRFENKSILEGGGTKDFRKQVWILDEASLSSAKQFIDMMMLARRTGARIAFQGDGAQLGSVEWGKLFIMLREHGMETAVLSEVMRQQDPLYREAVSLSIDNKYHEALNLLGENVIESKDSVEQLFSHWKGSDRDNTLVVIPDHSSIKSFTGRAREQLKSEGLLSHKEVETRIYEQDKQITEPLLSHGRFYKAGNYVTFNRGYKTLGIKKGDRLQIVSGTEEQVILLSDKGKNIEWNPVERKPKDTHISIGSAVKVGFSVGDKVVSTATIKAEKIKNGDAGIVIEAGEDGRIVVDYGKFTKSYSTSDILDIRHNYAQTAYKAQGLDKKHVLTAANSKSAFLINRKSFYVAMTRGKTGIKIFTDDKKALGDALIERLGEKTSALESQKIKQLAEAEQKKADLDFFHKLKNIVSRLSGGKSVSLGGVDEKIVGDKEIDGKGLAASLPEDNTLHKEAGLDKGFERSGGKAAKQSARSSEISTHEQKAKIAKVTEIKDRTPTKSIKSKVRSHEHER